MKEIDPEILTTTKLSSKGQVVIPEEIREAMGLEAGVQFVVVYQGDSIMLKVISPPSMNKLRALKEKVKLQAKKAGLTQEDVKDAIKAARKKK